MARKNAKKRKCSLDNCDRAHYGKGFCQLHYNRSRKKLPLNPYYGASKPLASSNFIIDNVDYKGMDCLLFPFKSNANGYGRVTYKGKRYHAHALMCELAHGKKLTPQHQALHLPIMCRNSNCVNPNHLRWGTISDNRLDSAIDIVADKGVDFINEILRWKTYKEQILNKKD